MEESEQAQEAWSRRCNADFKARNVLADYKAALKAEIEKQREGTYWLGESKEKALDFLLSLLDTVKPR